MTVQSLGVTVLTSLMRSERRRDLDSSWLLFGPEEPPIEEAELEVASQEPWRFAAE